MYYIYIYYIYIHSPVHHQIPKFPIESTGSHGSHRMGGLPLLGLRQYHIPFHSSIIMFPTNIPMFIMFGETTCSVIFINTYRPIGPPSLVVYPAVSISFRMKCPSWSKHHFVKPTPILNQPHFWHHTQIPADRVSWRLAGQRPRSSRWHPRSKCHWAAPNLRRSQVSERVAATARQVMPRCSGSSGRTCTRLHVCVCMYIYIILLLIIKLYIVYRVYVFMIFHGVADIFGVPFLRGTCTVGYIFASQTLVRIGPHQTHQTTSI